MSGSSNIQQFNPTEANQLNDAAYTADATRTGGAGVDAIWPSASANKTLYQLSTMCAALAQALANKGFTVSDANLAALTTVMSNIITSADVRGNLQVIAYSSSIVLNCASYLGFQISLGASPIALSVLNPQAGDIIVLLFVQDSSGGGAVNFSASFINAVQPDTAANVISCQAFKVTSTLHLQAMGPNISINGINNTPIGESDPAPGAFTSLSASTQLTAPTVVNTDNSTKAVTTAWAKFGFSVSLGSAGYFKFPTWLGGLAIQWGSVSASGGTGPFGTITFPSATVFATACVFVGGNANACVNGSSLNNSGDIPFVCFDSFTTTTARWRMDTNKGDGFGTVPLTWFAVGY